MVQFCVNRVMVVTFTCARGRKTLQMHGFSMQLWGTLLGMEFQN